MIARLSKDRVSEFKSIVQRLEKLRCEDHVDNMQIVRRAILRRLHKQLRQMGVTTVKREFFK
jgi:hypothetical protein